MDITPPPSITPSPLTVNQTMQQSFAKFDQYMKQYIEWRISNLQITFPELEHRINASEKLANKVGEINPGSPDTGIQYPTVWAVMDYVDKHGGSGSGNGQLGNGVTIDGNGITVETSEEGSGTTTTHTYNFPGVDGNLLVTGNLGSAVATLSGISFLSDKGKLVTLTFAEGTLKFEYDYEPIIYTGSDGSVTTLAATDGGVVQSTFSLAKPPTGKKWVAYKVDGSTSTVTSTLDSGLEEDGDMLVVPVELFDLDTKYELKLENVETA